jgi:hypothetical protein
VAVISQDDAHGHLRSQHASWSGWRTETQVPNSRVCWRVEDQTGRTETQAPLVPTILVTILLRAPQVACLPVDGAGEEGSSESGAQVCRASTVLVPALIAAPIVTCVSTAELAGSTERSTPCAPSHRHLIRQPRLDGFLATLGTVLIDVDATR